MAWSEMDYLKTVRDIAMEAIEEYPFTTGLNNEKRQEYVSESVDGNEYVIYYSANEIALRASDNEPDGEGVRGLSANNADWRTMKTLATYLAMECDVMTEIDQIFWAPFADGAREQFIVSVNLYKHLLGLQTR